MAASKFKGRNYNNNDLHDWDPMSADYNNQVFNSYNRGPGLKLESQFMPGERRVYSSDGYRLYVKNVPRDMTKEILFNIFSSCGQVLSAFVGKPKGPFNIGFVTYRTSREAEKAIREISGAGPFNLHVEYSEDPVGKQLRHQQQIAYAEQNSYSTQSSGPIANTKKLGIGRGISKDLTLSRFSGVGVNPQQIYASYYRPNNYYDICEEDYDNGYFNPYDGGPYESTNNVMEPLIRVDGAGNRSVSQGRGFISIKRGEVNYKVHLHSEKRNIKLRNAVGPYVMETIRVFDNKEDDSRPENYVREKCAVCSTLTNAVCSGCDSVYYCSRDCQIKEWPKHRNNCKRSSAEKSNRREKTSTVADSISKSSKAVEYNTPKPNDRDSGKRDEYKKPVYNKGDRNENMKPVYNKGDRNENMKPNKFQAKKLDDKKRQQPSGTGISNFYQRPYNKQGEGSQMDDDKWDVNAGGDNLAKESSPEKKRSVADHIKMSADTQNSIKTVPVVAESSLLHSPATSFATSTPVAMKADVKTDQTTSPLVSAVNVPSKTSVQKPTAKNPFFVPGVPVEIVKQHSLSDNDCYVVKKEDVERFSELFEKINRLMTDASPSVSEITLNLKCAAKYEDSWFRAKVVSVAPPKILFVDYGNEELITNPAEIKVLPEEFRSVLPFAAKVHFNEGDLKGVQWEDGDVIKVVPISKEHDGKWSVKLATNVDQSIHQPLLESSTSAADQTVNKVSSSTNEVVAQPATCVSSSSRTPAVGSTEGLPSNYKPKELDPSLNLFNGGKRTWSDNIVEDITVDSHLILNVEEINNDRNITASAFCKTVPYVAKLIELNMCYLSKAPLDPSYRPKTGDVVGVHIGNGEWTRALVNSISSDGALSVYLLDKGTKRNNVKEVKKLPGDSALYPRLAVTVTSHSDLSGRLLAGSILVFSLKSTDKEGWIGKIKKVQLDNNNDVKSEEEIGTGHLEAWEPEFVDVGRLDCVKLEPGLTVIISGGHDANNMYVKPVTDDLVQFYEDLEQEVAANCYQAKCLDVEPRLGDVVCAKWEVDGNFYRAQVLKKQKKDRFRVIFVDFGNVADVKFEDMVPISPTLKNKPCCAVRIGLKDVPMKPFTPSALEFINSLSEMAVQLTVEYKTLSSVKLIKLDKSVVNDKLVELMKPGWAKGNTEGKADEIEHVLRRDGLPPNKPLPENEIVQLAVLNLLPFSGEFIQFIMFDPDSDIFRHVSDTLPAQIEGYCASLPADDKYVPRTGELCIAKFADDGLHYRAECAKAHEYCASVLFVDYGNFGDVPFQDIHKMPADLMTTPAMGLLCNVKDIPYSEEIYNKIDALETFGNKYDVKILKRKNDEYDVHIPAITEQLKSQGII